MWIGVTFFTPFDVNISEVVLIHMKAKRIGLSHFKFAVEIVAPMLVADVPEEHRGQLEAYLQRLADLLPALVLLEDILVLYAVDRRLV